MAPNVAEIIKIMEEIAPVQMAEEWDNCGLQIGDINRPVNKIWIALDPLLKVIENAATNQIDMVITHHPLLLKPLRTIDLCSPIGKIISLSIKHHIAIYSAHTNFDAVTGGLNDMLADVLGLTSIRLLTQSNTKEKFSAPDHGIGRIGTLSPPLTLTQLATDIKKRLKLDSIKVSGPATLTIEKVAICTGSGSSLLKSFFTSGADVYISGDLKYHDAREAEEKGLALIDIGHYASEHIFIERLQKILQKKMLEKQFSGEVLSCGVETEPFFTI